MARQVVNRCSSYRVVSGDDIVRQVPYQQRVQQAQLIWSRMLGAVEAGLASSKGPYGCRPLSKPSDRSAGSLAKRARDRRSPRAIVRPGNTAPRPQSIRSCAFLEAIRAGARDALSTQTARVTLSRPKPSRCVRPPTVLPKSCRRLRACLLRISGRWQEHLRGGGVGPGHGIGYLVLWTQE